MKCRWILLTLVVLLVAAVASAQPAPPPGPNAVRPQVVLAKYLQLTPEQATAWQQIARDTAATVEPLGASAGDLQKQLETSLGVPTPDPLTVGKLAVSLHAVREQIRAAHEGAKAKRLALLTPEQKSRLEAFEAAMAFTSHARRGARAGAMAR